LQLVDRVAPGGLGQACRGLASHRLGRLP
jgi:hypothetical protein